MNYTRLNEEMEELIENLKNDKMMVSTAREINKSYSTMVSAARGKLEYNKIRNINEGIDLYETK